MMRLPPELPENHCVEPLEYDFQNYLKALIEGDRRTCRTVFESWLERGIDLRRLYEELVQRSLYAVGDLWERGQISVAVEHLATAITESLLNLVYPVLFSQPHVGKSAVVSCAANEYHQIGGKMTADIFELNGWRGYFLGANTPPADLLALVKEKRPMVVAMSLTVYFNLDSLLRTISLIRAKFPNLPILVGGQAFRWGGSERVEQIDGVRYLRSLAELEAWIRVSGDEPHPDWTL